MYFTSEQPSFFLNMGSITTEKGQNTGFGSALESCQIIPNLQGEVPL